MLRMFLLLLGFTLPVWAQVGQIIPEREPDGGGSFVPVKASCLSPHEHQILKTALKNQVEVLSAQGKIEVKKDAMRPILTSPMAMQTQVKGYNPWIIVNYVDQEGAFPANLLDYNGGQRTYDLESGYNHQGIDYTLWPFQWDMMAKREVAVIAAAPGVIVFKRDNEPDLNCGFANDVRWNTVFVRHDDGSTAWYGHLAAGTLTAKEPGDRVERGEFLGFVGSSGSSTAPHLHFELYDSEGNLNDPFSGPYNFLNQESWWADQEPYHNSYITKMYSHSDVPVIGNCPGEEQPNFKNVFQQGETAQLAIYLRDQVGTQIVTLSIVNPDGQEIAKWNYKPNISHFSSVWWYWSFTAEPSHADGVYLWRAFYLDKTTEHAFGIGAIGEPVFDEFSLSKAAISPGESVSVSWATSGVLELYLDQGHGQQRVDGSTTLSPTVSTTYTLTAKGPSGEITRTFEIEVTSASERFFSHVTPDNTAFITDFILANPSDDELRYQFQPYDSAGNALEAVTGLVGANQTQHLSKQDLFGSAPVSHFGIQADDRLAVSASYRTAAGSPAHLTDVALQARRWRVYTGDWSIIWDGLAVVNRGDAATEIFVAQMDANGQEVKKVSLGTVARNSKTLAVLASLDFTNTPGTHFVISADQNLAITALRGQFDALYLWENKAIRD